MAKGEEDRVTSLFHNDDRQMSPVREAWLKSLIKDSVLPLPTYPGENPENIVIPGVNPL